MDEAAQYGSPDEGTLASRSEVDPPGVDGVWLERYRRIWEGNFERLDQLLEGMKSKDKHRDRRQKKR